MKWKDILKNVIPQGRVKEIEDIDIDIEDDDCLRWLKRLFDMSEPRDEGSGIFEILNEADACAMKEGLMSLKDTTPAKKDLTDSPYTRGVIYKKLKQNENIFFTAFVKGKYDVTMTLFSQYKPNEKQGSSTFLVTRYFDSDDESKRTIKRVSSHLGFNAQEIFESLGV
tara:strand:- start:37 stop:540 length:504 start_codon:yes stop_codon:yes gene_type:complete